MIQTNKDNDIPIQRTSAIKPNSFSGGSLPIFNDLTSLLTILANLLLGKLLSYGEDNLNKAIHEKETIKTEGLEARNNIKMIDQEFNSTYPAAQKKAARYDQLLKGVDLNGNKTNKLSTKEYEEFLELNNELADLYPDLAYHYDIYGNKILELGQNADSSRKMLNDFIEEERQASRLEIQGNLPQIYEESKLTFNKVKPSREIYDSPQYDKYKKYTEEDWINNNFSQKKGFGVFHLKNTDPGKYKLKEIIEQAAEEAGISYKLRSEELIDETVLLTEKLSESEQEAFITQLMNHLSNTKQEKNLQTANTYLASALLSDITKSNQYLDSAPDTQNIIKAAISNMDFSNFNYGSPEELQQQIEDEIRNITSSEEKKSAYKEFLSLNPNEFIFDDYKDKIEQLTEEILGSDADNEQEKINFRLKYGITLESADGEGDEFQADNLLSQIETMTGISKDSLSGTLTETQIGIAYDIIMNDDNGSIKTLSDLINAVEKEDSLGISLDSSQVTGAEERLYSLNDQMEDAVAAKAFDVDTSSVENANMVISDCLSQLDNPTVMSVDTSFVNGEMEQAAGLLYAFQENYGNINIQTDVSTDTSSAEGSILGYYEQIQQLHPTILASLGITDTSSPEAIAAQLQNSNPHVSVQLGYRADASRSLLNPILPPLMRSVMYKANVGMLPYSFPDIIRYVQYRVANTGSGGSTKKGSSGGSAAGGSWGIKSGGTALVGELGPEIIVDPSSGRWHTVGNAGAEFTYLPAGAIVFNHQQSETLLERGRINGRGMALAQGTALADGSSVSSVTSGKNIIRDLAGLSQAAALSGSMAKASESAEDFNSQIDWMETRLKKVKDIYDQISKIIDDTASNLSAEQTINELNDAVQSAKEYISVLNNAAVSYQSYADSLGLSSDYIDKIKNGTMDIQTITDKNLKEQISEYQTWYNKAADCYDTVRSLNNEIKKLQLQKLDTVVKWADARIDYQESLSNRMKAYMDLADTKGIDNTESQYNYMIDRQVTINGKLNAELDNLKNQLQSLMSQGVIQKYSTEWHDWMSKIYDTETAITKTESSVEKLKNELYELRWEKFDKGIDVLKDAESELSDLINLYDNSLLFDDNGGTTAEGKAMVGLYGQQIELAVLKSRQYSDALSALRKDLKNGNISQNEYNETVKEYSQLQRDAAGDIKKYKDSIVKLIAEGIEKETDAYSKLNDAKKEALRTQKDLDNYNKKVSEQSDAISKLEAEYASLTGVNSREAQAKREQLMQEISDAKKELTELQEDRAYDEQLEYLDKDTENFKKMQEERTDMVKQDLDYQNAAIAAILSEAGTDSEAVLASIKAIAGNYGMEIGNALTAPWESAVTAMQEYLFILNSMGIGIGNVTTGPIHSPDYLQSIITSNYSNVPGSIGSFTEDQRWKDLQHKIATLQSGSSSMEEIVQMILDSFKGKKYASGTIYAKKGLHLTNESGLEAIMTKDGLLTPFSGGEAVFNRKATDALYEFANNPAIYLQKQLYPVRFPKVNPTNAVSVHYDSLITVNGDVIKDTIPTISELVKNAVPAVKQNLKQELKLLGNAVNYYR
ncbi:hypothetical protein LQE92_07550 [Lacrimispora sp. NSJ-141]|uniref:Uncharacterized protein n=1 Tax=Lientehia hominis TaxID=2897778 RepID=A0AAP2RIY2_9FIRM|nr:hypothetical protein [Lientehia hominis]MCD2492485.1 hypothetical protein [Lientehia hominis]